MAVLYLLCGNAVPILLNLYTLSHIHVLWKQDDKTLLPPKGPAHVLS